MSDPTPRPWHRVHHEAVKGSERYSVVQITDPNNHGAYSWAEVHGPNSVANAELLFLAVNGFHDLLAIAERCEMWLSTHPEGEAMMMATRAEITKARGKP